MTPGMLKPPWHFLFDNAVMWGACKEKEEREKGRTGVWWTGVGGVEVEWGTGLPVPE
jgi:hypothetical protein